MTRFAVTAERAALAALGGGCQVPIGIHCRVASAQVGLVEIFGVVAAPATGRAIRAHETAPRQHTDPENLGRVIAGKLLDAGAREMLPAISLIPGGAD
jgi:hydroxymethylbilane synthase